MMRKTFKTTALVLSFALTLGCASLNNGHSIEFSRFHNRKIYLLAWSYAGDYGEAEGKGFAHIARDATDISKEWKIKWKNNLTDEIFEESLPIKNLPINMRNSTIRLIFNKHNKPELYVIYEGPDPYGPIEFEGSIYTQVRIRQIYPIKKELVFPRK